MEKLTLKEIHEVIENEDKCGVVNLLQEIFASEFAETGIDVIDDGKNYNVVQGITLKVTTENPKRER